MTSDEKNRLTAMRRAGRSYTEIALELGIAKNTVKTYCHRNHIASNSDIAGDSEASPPREKLCLCCGVPVAQNPGRKEKKFCSDVCRAKWWNTNTAMNNRKSMYDYVCPTCGNPFSAYGNRHRKYCSHECYIADRFGGRS